MGSTWRVRFALAAHKVRLMLHQGLTQWTLMFLLHQGLTQWTLMIQVRTISTEISTAGIGPLFSNQCRVFLSSGQPTPGP